MLGETDRWDDSLPSPGLAGFLDKVAFLVSASCGDWKELGPGHGVTLLSHLVPHLLLLAAQYGGSGQGLWGWKA